MTKESITIEDIQSLIDNGIGESLNLEYKGAGALKKDDPAKIKITKSISAFANSNGGILIYGIHEEDQQPKNISYIDGNVFSNEWLEQVIGNIHRKVKVEIIPVRLDNDLSKTVYVVRIPESTEAPHMALDGKYYRRMNFQVVQMEEYEVRNLYYRQDSAELNIADTFLIKYEGHPNKEYDKHSFKLTFSVVNRSKVLEKEYKLTLSFEDIEGLSMSWEKENKYIVTPSNKTIISTTTMVPIFPNEELCIMVITVHLLDKNIEDNLIKGKLIKTLNFSSGTEITTMNFMHVFRTTMLEKGIITEDNKFNPTSRLKQHVID